MKILFTPLIAGKPWNGATLHTEPLGGSESAVAYLSRALAKRGHQVYVATHGNPSTFDGVTYVFHTELGHLIADNEWDVVVSSRWLDILGYEWRTRLKILWLHDGPSGPYNIRANHCVMLTKAHADMWMMPKEDYTIIGNGVDLSLFAGPELERDPNVLMWTSNPDRGLPVAARIFQEVRKRWPEMELHVYGRSSVYGWGPEVEASHLPLPEHSENVFLHDPLTKAALATELRKAWAWFYPTYWHETYCIAGLEAQAAGTPCITVPRAALNETIKGGVVSYDILNAVSQLRNRSKWQKESERGKEFANRLDWSARAQQWENMLNKFLGGES